MTYTWRTISEDIFQTTKDWRIGKADLALQTNDIQMEP